MTTTDRTGADTATFEAELDRLDRLEVADEDTVERVARAIAEAQGCGRTATPLTRSLARAAIDALKPAPDTDSSGQMVVDVLLGGEHVATLGAVYGSVSVDSSGQAVQCDEDGCPYEPHHGVAWAVDACRFAR